MYEYRAAVVRVVDGDTVRLDIDLGMDVHIYDVSCRLEGIDAPEAHTPEGRASKLWLANLLRPGTEVCVKTTKADKYGRYLVKMWLGEQHVNAALVDAGHAHWKTW
ncbi:hypothetical protein GCM10012275_28130 [Longimycelium tulufanense]|uniref:TNase-like domain-containing protein n=1 Tax=Longimycelium tulufanense TaxID=907463 RepID=A0A8J3FV54_9PSEU|nr:thermonuclease family protein [Longimycelium tulufanense]GGM55356.1 hypothetical protein GCM10012275_28130 [Longimycelium tulufanense]